MSRIITELELDHWVRDDQLHAERIIPELVWRLVRRSCPDARERRFPTHDSINQPGLDGILDTDRGFGAFVPAGRSCWEIGINTDVETKAADDYAKRTTGKQTAVPENERAESTFVFVSPLSAQRSWRKESQSAWLVRYGDRHEWANICILDGTKIVDWLEDFPEVEVWLAGQMGIHAGQIETVKQHWDKLSTIGSYRLIPELYLMGRENVSAALEQVFAGEQKQLEIDSYFPGEAVDFLSAFVASKESDAGETAFGQCLIVSGREAFDDICSLQTTRVLVLDFPLADDNAMTSAIAQAKSKGNAVVFEGAPGGEANSGRVMLAKLHRHTIEENLKKAGYPEQLAWSLAQESDQNLGALRGLIAGIGAQPEWSHNETSNYLALAQLVGGWREDMPSDKTAVEQLSNQDYAAWTTQLRNTVSQRRSPLVRNGNTWQFVARYEGWQCLGRLIYDENLERFQRVAVDVLGECDPQFDLPSDKRFAASIYGKTLTHSSQLRKGLAGTLALLGSHPKALTSCSKGKAESVAILTVRDTLFGADWIRWASLNDLLPLLAEAAPHEFLDIMEKTLCSTPCPFDAIFAQESPEFGGGNYMTGVLWALETIAWDPDCLIPAVTVLGQLATRDPGGNSANRPAQSLSTILLPWFPQTCASLDQRKTAIHTLLRESPDVGWKTLLELLPASHQISMGSRRPAWRATIPDDRVAGVSPEERWRQACSYADIAIDVSIDNIPRLAVLVDRLDDLPQPARERLLVHLSSERVMSTPEMDRFQLWDHLTSLVSKHRGFADAQWALEPETIDEIGAVAQMLTPKSPFLLHQRLFSSDYLEFFDEKTEYEEQERRLDEQQQKAVRDIYATTGPERLLTFARNVKSPMRVGSALGAIADDAIDRSFLPSLLRPEQDLALRDFIRGYVLRRLQTKGWSWVDGLGTPKWNPSETGQLLIYLPFSDETWRRASLSLADDDSLYWSKAVVNPYVTDEKLEFAVDRLVAHDRPYAAIRCIASMIHEKKTLDGHQIVRALLATLHTLETPAQGRGRDIAKAVQAVQEDSEVDRDEVAHIEWVFLPLLDGDFGASARFLEQRLADRPDFYCEIIRTVFRSEKEQGVDREITEEQGRMAANAYELLQQWKTPPGNREDGTFDSDAMRAWFESMKKISGESGHLGSAMRMAGKVLIYVRPDPNGLWLHHAAADELNAKDADDLRNGFWTGLFNSRGVHSIDPKGQEERNLANKYREQADQVESAGYQRLAATLRQLASEYDHEADQQVLEDRLDE